jgi:predicted dehydrogenase
MNVFVEKPLSMTVESAEQVLAAAEKWQKKVFVGHIMHYHMSFQRLRAWLVEHPEEHIECICSERGHYNSEIRNTGSLLWDLGPHDVSAVAALADNSEVKEVSATELTSGGTAMDISAYVLFENGIKAHFRWTNLDLSKRASYTVLTTNNVLKFDDVQKQQGEKFVTVRRVQRDLKVVYPNSLEYVSPLENELNAMKKYFESGVEPVTIGPEGLNVMRVVKSDRVCNFHT